MPATLSRPGPATLVPDLRAAREDRLTPRPAPAAPGATTVRSWLRPASSTAFLTIGQPPRPRLFEHEILTVGDN
ncbi:MAG: hypothetical protein K2Q20_09215 [Phycisphaerales bacterium]|nr:hypothetical protein [Phycisphaerales bacterium]